MNKNLQRFYFCTAAGASLAIVLLIGIAFIPFVEGVGYPGTEVLSGQMQLSSSQFAAYVFSIRLDLWLDGLFLIGCLLAWMGLTLHIHGTHKTLALATLILAVLGILLDFTENTFVWCTLKQVINGDNPGSAWYTPWHISQQLSYWLAFIPAVLSSIVLWKGDGWEKTLSVCGTVLVIPAMLGMFIAALEIVSIVWYLFWFAFAAVVLWRRYDSLIHLNINKEKAHV
jgi:hypothetical protein